MKHLTEYISEGIFDIEDTDEVDVFLRTLNKNMTTQEFYEWVVKLKQLFRQQGINLQKSTTRNKYVNITIGVSRRNNAKLCTVQLQNGDKAILLKMFAGKLRAVRISHVNVITSSYVPTNALKVAFFDRVYNAVEALGVEDSIL